MRPFFNWRLTTSLGAAGMIVAAVGVPLSSAQAQDESGASAATKSASGTDADRSFADIGDIIVTATRSSQLLSRVPASITAFDQAKLDEQGVRNVNDVARLVPGVSFTKLGYANTTQITIRGIGSSVGASTTGVYIDDTPIQVRSLGFVSSTSYPEVFDLERVEILRGPQGTLFGAGSEGGTVRFITPQPGFSKFSAYGRGELSFTESGSPSWEAGAAVGGPMVEDQLAFRASVWRRHDGGFIDHVSNIDGSLIEKDADSRDAFAARFALGMKLGEGLTITPSIYYQRSNLHGTSQYMERISDPDRGIFRSAEPLNESSRDSFVLPSLNIEAVLGDFTLTSVTSKFIRRGRPFQDFSLTLNAFILGRETYRDLLYPALLPGYTMGSAFNVKQDSFTQEVRLQFARPESRLSGVVGIFLERAKQFARQTLVDPQLPQLVATYFGGATVEQVFGVPMVDANTSYISDDSTNDRQDAIFGEINYRITDALKLTVGARYAKTSVDYMTFQTGPWAGNSGLTTVGGQKEKPFTPKFGLSYEFDSRNMVYAIASKGFRVGGVNKPIPVTTDACRADLAAFGLTQAIGPYNSDSVWSYEVGAKNGNLFNGRLQLYTSAYYIKWSNIQQSVTLAGCGFPFVNNLGSAVSKGAEIQFQAQLTDGFRLGGSVAYNSGYYTSQVLGAPAGPNNVRGVIVNKGNALPSTPWMVTLDADYQHEFAVDRQAYARLTYTFRSRNNRNSPIQDPTTIAYDPDELRPVSTHLVNARAGVRLNQFDISLFVNNVFDSHPVLTRDNLQSGLLLFFNTTFTPRTVGVTGTFKY